MQAGMLYGMLFIKGVRVYIYDQLWILPEMTKPSASGHTSSPRTMSGWTLGRWGAWHRPQSQTPVCSRSSASLCPPAKFRVCPRCWWCLAKEISAPRRVGHRVRRWVRSRTRVLYPTWLLYFTTDDNLCFLFGFIKGSRGYNGFHACDPIRTPWLSLLTGVIVKFPSLFQPNNN